MRPSVPVLACLALLLACGTPERKEAATAPPAPTSAPPSGRRLADGERAAMLAALGAEPGAGRTIWFAVAAGDAEATAFKDALAAVFQQAGWRTETQPVTGMVLKPGLSILVGAEEPPAYVAAAQQALQSTGFEFKTGTGYAAYFAERKQADPRWPGIPLAAGQDFVVVVGPTAAPAP